MVLPLASRIELIELDAVNVMLAFFHRSIGMSFTDGKVECLPAALQTHLPWRRLWDLDPR